MNAPDAQPHRLQTRERIARLQCRLGAWGLTHRAPPPEPTTCCGRGCNGCVWEGYETALAWWLQEAQAMLAMAQSPSATTAPEGSNGTKEPT